VGVAVGGVDRGGRWGEGGEVWVVVKELQTREGGGGGGGAEAYLITEVAEAVVERIRLIADQ